MFPTIGNPNLNFSECETCPEIAVMGPSGDMSWRVDLGALNKNKGYGNVDLPLIIFKVDFLYVESISVHTSVVSKQG